MRRRTTAVVSLATAAVLGVGAPVATHALPHAAATGSTGTTGSTENAPYLVGTGIYDITGAVAQTGAFGYAANQEMNGLHDRLYARAFNVVDQASGKRVVFVNVDLGATFASVKLAVTKKLQARYGALYGADNVMISATHTHVGTAGLSHDTLYQIAANDRSGHGYDQRNFDGVVDGIVAAVGRAHDSLRPGTLDLAEGILAGATKNRSTRAYRANEDARYYDQDVNQTMTQLTVRDTDGTPRGLVNWFSIHPTSFSLKTTQISADNKGYAQYFTERDHGSTPTDAAPFVAAFAQSDEGDVVSSQGNSFSSPGFEGAADDEVNVAVDGERQLAKSRQLLAGPSTQLTGAVDYRYRWVNLTGYTVDAKYTGGEGPQTLCRPARGFSFAPGAENGPSKIPGLYEGMTKGSFSVTDAVNRVDQSALGATVRAAFGTISAAYQDDCQAEKQVLLPTGAWGWAPTTLPVQIVRIGGLALVGVPGELTTMGGRHLRALVAEQLKGSGVEKVVVAGLANDYTGYITTRDEYRTQQYEGASMEFGPHELGAFEQEFVGLAKAMADGTPVTSDPAPRDVTPPASATRAGVVLDDVPPGQTFGQVLTQPQGAYAPGATASAVFRAGHPKNDYRRMGTFLRVQRQVDGRWVDYLDDHDWATSYTWAREGASYSRATVTWRIAKDTPAGTYRLVQTGDWKNGWNGTITPYTGTSAPFTVG